MDKAGEWGQAESLCRSQAGWHRGTMDNGSHQVRVHKPGVCERSNSAGRDLRRKVVVVVLTEGRVVGEWRLASNECGAG